MAQLRGFMTRSVVLLSVLFGACTVGEVPPVGGGGDAGTADRAVCVQRPATPAPAHQHAAEGANPAGARSGIGCVVAGCHAAGQLGAGATAFAFAGTVYKATDGAAVAPGVTIRMYKPMGTASLAKATTDDAGNFIIRGTFDQFPYETQVAGCGPAAPNDIRPMITPISAPNDRNCSSGACHAIPGGAAGAAYLGDT